MRLSTGPQTRRAACLALTLPAALACSGNTSARPGPAPSTHSVEPVRTPTSEPEPEPEPGVRLAHDAAVAQPQRHADPPAQARVTDAHVPDPDDAGPERPPTDLGAGAGAGGMAPREPAADGGGSAGYGGGKLFCLHPPDCLSVFTAAVGLATCCPQNGEACGYSVAYPSSLDDGSCRPNSAVFLELPGQPEQRVTTPGAPDQLITPLCGSRGVLAFSFPGCCMPDDRCGVSTYQLADILLGLAGVPAPFTRPECVSVETLNAQLRATALAGMGQLAPSTDSCDYADLQARLPAQTD